MRRGPWTLVGRLTRWFLTGTVLLVGAISVLSVWYLEGSVRREIASLVLEELDEVAALFPTTDGSRQAFEALRSELQHNHPGIPMAWRIWEPEGTEPWGEFGALELLTEDAPGRGPLDTDHALAAHLRWRSKELSDGRTVSLILDGSSRVAFVRRYELYAGILLAVASALSLAFGTRFARRVSRLLRRVADGARSVRGAGEEVRLDVEDAPEEIREVAAALREMLETVRRESEKARLFVAGTAHELRSPIQNLIGETEVALLRPRSADEYREILESHLDELRDLGDAVDNLVSLCSARTPDEEPELEEFDLGEEAELRLRRELRAADRCGVKVDLALEGDLRIRGDREALLRAVRNLTANAIQWSPPDGRASVSLIGGPDDVTITVDDAGPGVPEEEREAIFEPFHRGPTAQQRRAGYGLGLALAREAADLHGGRIEVGRSPAGGARFRLVVARGGRRAPRPDSGARA